MRLRPLASLKVGILLLVIGLQFRMAFLTSPGTEDLGAFGVWTYHAVQDGVTTVYGLDGGWQPRANLISFDGTLAHVDYPPGTVLAMAVAGRLFDAVAGGVRTLRDAIVPVKLLAITANALLALLIWWTVGRRATVARARLAALTFWGNPAVILHTAILGYVGSLATVPALAALLAAERGRPRLAGGLWALALLTKPLALLFGPALVLALIRDRPLARARVTRAGSGAVLVTAIILTPIALAGALPNVAHAVIGLVTDGWLSAQAANLWWLVGFGVQVARHAGQDGLIALQTQNSLISLSGLPGLPGGIAGRSTAFFAVLAVSWCGVLAVIGWAMRRVGRHNTPDARLALAAFVVHVYFMFALQVHENHLVLTLPLMTILAVERHAYRWLLGAVSLLVLLNLNLFYGLGQGGMFALPRMATGVDATVLLSVVSLVIFGWHARVFTTTCRARSQLDLTPGVKYTIRSTSGV